MSRSLNKALLIGNLGSDPEIRTTGDDTKVAGLSLATSRSWTDREGQPQERTEWHRVVAWANLAEIAEQYLHKGDRVYIEGEIQYRSYEDREGATRYVTEIRARELVMLGGRESGATGHSEAGNDSRKKPVPNRKAKAGGRTSSKAGRPDDDLPF
jgi:single-strand DNA-binding protein